MKTAPKMTTVHGTHLSVLVGRVTEMSPRMRCRISVAGLGSADEISPKPSRMSRI